MERLLRIHATFQANQPDQPGNSRKPHSNPYSRCVHVESLSAGSLWADTSEPGRCPGVVFRRCLLRATVLLLQAGSPPRKPLQCLPVSSWRYWLVELPSRTTEVASVWFRLYFTVLLVIAAVSVPATVLAMLVLWFGFGIRWGW